MSNKPTWMVRVERGAHAASEFRDKAVVGICWASRQDGGWMKPRLGF